MRNQYTFLAKQELIQYEGLVYKMVWQCTGVEAWRDYEEINFRGDYQTRVFPTNYAMEFAWEPPLHLGTGTVKTRGLQAAIDLGFLVLVAPVKR